MKFTKEQLEEFRNDPLMNFFAGLFGTTTEELVKGYEAEDKSHVEAKEESIKEKKDEIGEKIKKFFDKLVDEGKATATVEDGHPHYSIKMEDSYTEPENPETLVEENDGVSFSMSKEELKEFIKNYTKLENTFRKLEHTFGIDLNANADSIYTQYNAIVWGLMENIFGEDNRDDIADFCFDDSNFDSVDDLYEELV